VITAVLSGSLLQFKQWCGENGADPRDRNIVYVRHISDLRGLGKPVEVIVYGTFFEERKNAEQLHYETLMIQRQNKDLPDPDPPRPWSWSITTP
jgi:hypothetical protein